MNHSIVRVGAYSSDPPACDAFHAFDPESYVVVSCINDSLIYIDRAGKMQPGLAMAWERVNPVTIDMSLRTGVRFHNGEPFNADSVVATMRAQRDPANQSPTGQGILSPIVECVALARDRVRFTTAFPDGMFLHRMHLFSAIYPQGVLAEAGPSAFLSHPIGTGAFMFEEWRKGEEIVLRRNPDHWAGLATVDELRFPIVTKKDWLDLLAAKKLDIAINVDPADSYRAATTSYSDTGLVTSRDEAALSQWFLLRHHGPLGDRRVRQALNHALHKPLLCKVAEYGWAAPQTSVQTPEQIGYNPDLRPYAYDLHEAMRLLREAGHADGFTLTGLVSESSSSVFQVARESLARIGVQLDAEVVPRGEWMMRVVVEKMTGKPGFQGDFVLSNVDNPLLHGLFHHFIFLFSQGPFSQLQSPEYDGLFLEAATSVDARAMESKLRELDRYVRDEALLLFTVRQQCHCVARRGYELPLSKSGHFNYDNFWHLRVTAEATLGVNSTESKPPRDDEVEQLVEATSYPGMLLHKARDRFSREGLENLWRNIVLGQARWEVQSQEMLRALVDQVEAHTWLQNISRSTRQVGIVVVRRDGHRVFCNDGYRDVVGIQSSEPLGEVLRDEAMQPCWERIVREVTETQGWSGIVHVEVGVGVRRRVFVTVNSAVNEVASEAGYVCVFSDYTSEEARLRLVEDAKTAALVQKALIPATKSKRYDIAEYYQPASETGGDWYCVQEGERFLTLMIGDVTGHGTAAALVTASVAGAVKVLDLEAEAPSSIITKLNRVVMSTGFGEYLMSFYVIKIEKTSLSFGYCCAGHHSPLFVSPGGGAPDTKEVGGELMGYATENLRWVTGEGRLEAGTAIVLYTDGLAEAENADGEMFGFGRMRRLFLANTGQRTSREIVSGLVEALREHVGGRPNDDDVTIVVATI